MINYFVIINKKLKLVHTQAIKVVVERALKYTNICNRAINILSCNFLEEIPRIFVFIYRCRAHPRKEKVCNS